MPSGQVQQQSAESIVRTLPRGAMGAARPDGELRTDFGANARTNATDTGTNTTYTATDTGAHTVVCKRQVP
jgi:hypothetical protein